MPLLPLILVLPFAGAALLARRTTNCHSLAWLAGLVTAAGLGITLWLGPAVLAGEVLATGFDWMPLIGLRCALRLDGLAYLFCLLILGIGLLIVLYARYYLGAADSMRRFYTCLLLFMGAMLGVVLADNLLLLALFWELTSLCSFLLIGYWNHREAARRAARMALTVTGAGGLALMGGLVMLGQMAGSYEMADVVAAHQQIIADPLYPVALALILAGAFTKSAQFPFHFWLPQAMAAPTPVSAYLHSATMVKMGVFLLARLFPVLAGTQLWFWSVGTVGLVTLVVGAFLALFRDDIKGLLAYSTISHLGLITLLFGFGTPLAAYAALFHIINHATFKASLFMAAGIIDHEAGTRDMRRLRGLARQMPHTALLATIAAAAMAGVPLLNGFLSKEMFFEQALQAGAGPLNWLVPVAALLGTVFSVAYSYRFVRMTFFGKPEIPLPRVPHEPPRWMKVPVECLVVICLLVGIFPNWTVAPLLDGAVQAVLAGPAPLVDLAIWHGFTAPLFMSVMAIAGGLLCYAFHPALQRLELRLVPSGGGKRLFDAALLLLLDWARRVALRSNAGSLSRSLTLLVGVSLVLGSLPWWNKLDWALPAWQVGERAAFWPALGLWALLIVSAAICVVWHRRRVIALICLGVVGLVVSLAFVCLSAPDLALTQLAVEVVTTILMVLALRWLPRIGEPDREPVRRRALHLLLAGLCGGGVMALMLAVFGRSVQPISAFFLEHSLAQGGGRNVVNVILVDFRGYDTLGEITVFGIAGLLVANLLGRLPQATASQALAMPLLLRAAVGCLLPFALLVAVYLFLRGHQAPGGGFVAGLVTAIALLMRHFSQAPAGARELRRLTDQHWIGLGLLLAVATGAAALCVGVPFLTSAHGHIDIPVLGEIELASASLFDLGVYGVVTGASLLMLGRLAAMRAKGVE